MSLISCNITPIYLGERARPIFCHELAELGLEPGGHPSRLGQPNRPGVREVRLTQSRPICGSAGHLHRLGADQRSVNQVLHQEPGLHLPGADDIRDNHIIGAVVAKFRDFRSGVVRVD